MDARERYFWDLTGYIVVRNVLNPDQIAAANEAIDLHRDRIRIADDNLGARDSHALRGTGRPTMHDLLQLERPYCDPFRQMLAHPAVVLRLNTMCGSGFRLDHGPLLISGVKGTEGLTMHGAGEPHRPHVAYNHQNGHSYCGGVTVSWQLADVNPDDGGFVCVPGSHKTGYPMPPGVRTCDDDMGTVVQPVMRAGDVLFFMDGAQTHGTRPWQSERPRRSVLYKYASRSSVRGGPAKELAPPEIYWGEDVVADMTDEQRAVMFGPYSNHRGEVPFLAVDDNGNVRIER